MKIKESQLKKLLKEEVIKLFEQQEEQVFEYTGSNLYARTPGDTNQIQLPANLYHIAMRLRRPISVHQFHRLAGLQSGAAERFEQPGHSRDQGQFDDFIMRAAREHHVPPVFIKSIIGTESSWRPDAVNPRSGASGLMQLMPGAASDMGLEWGDRFNPEANIMAGTRYLRWLADRYQVTGDDNLPSTRWDLVFSAYNAGPRRLDQVNQRQGVSEGDYANYQPWSATERYIGNVVGGINRHSEGHEPSDDFNDWYPMDFDEITNLFDAFDSRERVTYDDPHRETEVELEGPIGPSPIVGQGEAGPEPRDALPRPGEDPDPATPVAIDDRDFAPVLPPGTLEAEYEARAEDPDHRDHRHHRFGSHAVPSPVEAAWLRQQDLEDRRYRDATEREIYTSTTTLPRLRIPEPTPMWDPRLPRFSWPPPQRGPDRVSLSPGGIMENKRMKIKESQLKKLLKEEIKRLLEQPDVSPAFSKPDVTPAGSKIDPKIDASDIEDLERETKGWQKEDDEIAKEAERLGVSAIDPYIVGDFEGLSDAMLQMMMDVALDRYRQENQPPPPAEE